MSEIWQIDTCDSCASFTLTKIYSLDGEVFVWCDDCADPDAIEEVI